MLSCDFGPSCEFLLNNNEGLAVTQAGRGAQPAARVPKHSGRLLELPPEGGSGLGDLVYATVPLGSVATKVARDWLANESSTSSVPARGKIDG